MSKKLASAASWLVLIAIILSACGPAASLEGNRAMPAQALNGVPPTLMALTPTPTRNRVQIYWYIGLGAGTQADSIKLEKAWVDQYNKSQSEIQLIPIIVDNAYGRDNLLAQVAAGNAPDIVGPMGGAGRAAFPGAFLDLKPLIKEFNYDISELDPAFMSAYTEGGKLVGLPFAIYPSILFVNKMLFAAAGLELPPQKYGQKYTLDGREVDWDFDTVLEVAKRLTIDRNGHSAVQPDFDPTNIVQYGFTPEWVNEPRAFGTYFGAFYPVENGRAIISDNWKAAWKWYYAAMWQYHVAPNYAAQMSDLLKENAFSSGRVAMALSHLWYVCCIDPRVVKDWDLAIVPSYQGKVTAKMHSDTFAILASTKHPQEAFKVYTYMLGKGAPALYKIYGGLPAHKSQQAAFFQDLDDKFKPNQINWQVALDSIAYLDVPNHELGLPNNIKASNAFAKLGEDLSTTPDLDVDQRIADFTAELDQIIKAKP